MESIKKRTDGFEIDLLLEAIYMRWEYDFRNYARSSLKRRVQNRMKDAGFEHISQMIPAVIHDEKFFARFLQEMSITVTELFRDPEFYVDLRSLVVPVLGTYPFLKIWHAGCATGEEVYSMAIVLEEEGIYDRVAIYGTDINQNSLKTAEDGIYPIDRMKEYTENYNRSGGNSSFSDYYHSNDTSAKLVRRLGENATFSYHNLVCDRVFGEMNLIFCRNVLIYFDKELQERVLRLFCNSLCRGGFLCLGNNENIEFTSVRDEFEVISTDQKIYRKRL